MHARLVVGRVPAFGQPRVNPMLADEILDRLNEAGLSRIADRLEDDLPTSVRLVAERLNRPAPIGTTRFGGDPDLPADFEWPMSEGRPLAFLAQICLDDVSKAADLELSGWLYLFYDCEKMPSGYDPADRDHWHVFHFRGEREALRPRRQDGLPDPSRFPACSVRFEIEHQLPSAELLCDAFEIDLDADEEREYDRICDEVSRPGHRMFGLADEIQGDMTLECQLASNGLYVGDQTGYDDPRAAELEAGAGDWVLLLQLDSDDEAPGWMWGDCGRLYVWIRIQDLEEEQFDSTWWIVQCY